MTAGQLPADWPPASAAGPCGRGVDPARRQAALDLLYLEAALLDEMQLAKWLDLLAVDALYWVPLRWMAEHPSDHLNLVYDDRSLLTDRVLRLQSGDAYSQTPPSRTCRSISNPQVSVSMDNATEQEEVVLVRSVFDLTETRGEASRIYAGRYTHVLRNDGGQLRIARKRIDLLICDQVLPNLTFLL